MKVLFAVGHASTSENIAKKYLELFGEKLEYKDVFYFKAILEEVKRDSSYDRIIIAENLEPIHSNVIAEIDKMLFNNIDSITDEAEDTTILFICSESRTRNDPLLRRFYNIGIYNFLVGDERQIPSLCRLIKDPRTKKDAKNYLGGADLGDEVEDPNGSGVNESELVNILRFFENLRGPEQYLVNFENVCHQYDSDNDLSVIAAAICTQLKNGNEIFDALSRDPRFAKYLEWKKVQQQQAQEPQEQPKKGGGLFSILKKPGSAKPADANGIKNLFKKNKNPETAVVNNAPNNQYQQNPNSAQNQTDFYEQQRQAEMARQAALEQQRQADIARQMEAQRQAEIAKQQEEAERQRQAEIAKQMEAQRQAEIAKQQEEAERQRQAEIARQMEAQRQAEIARQAQTTASTTMPNNLNQVNVDPQQDAILKQMEAQRQAEIERLKQEEAQRQAEIARQKQAEAEKQRQAELEKQRQEEAERQRQAELERQRQAELERQRQAEEQRRLEELARMEQQVKNAQPINDVNSVSSYDSGYTTGTSNYQPYTPSTGGYSSYGTTTTDNYAQPYTPGVDSYSQYSNPSSNYNSYASAPVSEGDYDLKYTGPILEVPSDYKKVVAFVGTSKVGTSFLANTVATLLAMKGVKTSILDMTKNRGLYWFYSDEMYKRLDQVSTCMTDLSNGNATPIQVGKSRNLSLYTTIPKGREDNRKGYRHRAIIDTAKRNCNLLIIDCDFTTPIEYLEQAQEIYLVQDLDLVKCGETVEFLREMKQKHFDWSKFRLLINNFVKCNITPKRIRKEALTIYNDPNYTYNEDIEEIKKFLVIPMDPANYANYIDAMDRGKIAYEKFTDSLKGALEDLSTMVYGVPSKRKFGR